jgi:hypothetical protein
MTAAHVGGAFDPASRLIDVRSIAHAGGRHHVPHVGVHVLRPAVLEFRPPTAGAALSADAMAGVPVARPWPDGANTYAGYFQLAAQPGRKLRLFNADRREGHEMERSVEWRMPGRLHRLPLHDELEALRAAIARNAALPEAHWFEPSQPFTVFVREANAATFTQLLPEEVRIANLEAFPAPAAARPDNQREYAWFESDTNASPTVAAARKQKVPVRCGFDPVTGRLIVAKPWGANDIEEARVAYATGLGAEMGAGPHERNAAGVPFDVTDTASLTNFVRIVDATAAETGAPASRERRVKLLATALAEWTANGAGTRGFIVLTRCDREGASAQLTVTAHPGTELHIVSAQWRPRGHKPGATPNTGRHGSLVRRGRRFTIDAPVLVTPSAAPPGSQRAGVLVFDGVELTKGLSLAQDAFSRLLIRHCTVRAPQADAIASQRAINAAHLAIERSLVGRLALDEAGKPATGSLSIADSVVSDDGALDHAIEAESLDADLRNVTVLGTSTMKSLEATNAIFWQPVTVTRRQSGCMRYSSIAPKSQVPRRFRCQPEMALAAAADAASPTDLTDAQKESTALSVLPIFLDTSLDEPTVAMLHAVTSDRIRLGGEGDSEMGAFSSAAEGLRRANLTSLFDDYLPFGLEAAVLDDTRSSGAAQRRNTP